MILKKFLNINANILGRMIFLYERDIFVCFLENISIYLDW